MVFKLLFARPESKPYPIALLAAVLRARQLTISAALEAKVAACTCLETLKRTISPKDDLSQGRSLPRTISPTLRLNHTDDLSHVEAELTLD